jgi:hypothetical protein
MGAQPMKPGAGRLFSSAIPQCPAVLQTATVTSPADHNARRPGEYSGPPCQGSILNRRDCFRGPGLIPNYSASDQLGAKVNREELNESLPALSRRRGKCINDFARPWHRDNSRLPRSG